MALTKGQRLNAPPVGLSAFLHACIFAVPISPCFYVSQPHYLPAYLPACVSVSLTVCPFTSLPHTFECRSPSAPSSSSPSRNATKPKATSHSASEVTSPAPLYSFFLPCIALYLLIMFDIPCSCIASPCRFVSSA
jgi:hypothetical protein